MKKQGRKTQKKSNVIKTDRATGKEASVKGVVTARKCKQCGHHEIGIITEEGQYLALKPGMKVVLNKG
jgi:hypothetical protein